MHKCSSTFFLVDGIKLKNPHQIKFRNKFEMNNKQYTLITTILWFISCVLEVESKSKNARKQKGRSAKEFDPSAGLTVLTALMAVCFLTPLLYFAYTVAKDPITPSLVSNGFKAFQEKTMGYLSKSKKKDT